MTGLPRPGFILPSSASIPYGRVDAEHDALIALINHARDVAEATACSTEKLSPLYRELQQKFEVHFCQ